MNATGQWVSRRFPPVMALDSMSDKDMGVCCYYGESAALDEFKEEQHPRGQPENAGQFTSGGGGATKTITQPKEPHARSTEAGGAAPAAATGQRGQGAGRGGATSPAEAQSRAAQAASGHPKLAGLPDQPLKIGDEYYVPGPLAAAKQAAEKYMRQAGLPYNPPKQYTPVDKEVATRQGIVVMNTPTTRRSRLVCGH
jgi:hypothetical protein